MEKSTSHGYVINNKIDIDNFRILTLIQGLKLEMKGLKMSRGRSCYQTIKNEFGLKGSREKVYNHMITIYHEWKNQQS